MISQNHMFNFNELKEKTKGVEEWLQKELSVIRTGRATPMILDFVQVEAYDQKMSIKELANILVGVISQRLLPRSGGGLIPAVEIMSSNNAVRNVIREGRSYELPNIIHTSGSEGMIALDKYLAELVRKGLVKLEEAMPFANNQDLFKSLVKRY